MTGSALVPTTAIAALLDPDRVSPADFATLDDLAGAIVGFHHAAERHGREAIGRAIAAGELLMEAKRRVRAGRGRWLDWIAANLPITPRQVQKYVEVARNRERLENANPGSHLTGAVRQLRDQRRIGRETAARVETRDRAQALIAADEASVTFAIRDVLDLVDDEEAVPSSGISAVITDPEYAEDAVPLYGALYRLATRALESGGWMAVLTGCLHLPRLFLQMPDDPDRGLAYRGMLGWYTPGGHTPMIPRTGLYQHVKPVLLYQKPPLAPISPMAPNLLRLDKGDAAQLEHPWQQSVVGFMALVEMLTLLHGRVLDPFYGSGTCGIACAALKRNCLGFDIEPATTPPRSAIRDEAA